MRYVIGVASFGLVHEFFNLVLSCSSSNFGIRRVPTGRSVDRAGSMFSFGTALHLVRAIILGGMLSFDGLVSFSTLFRPNNLVRRIPYPPLGNRSFGSNHGNTRHVDPVTFFHEGGLSARSRSRVITRACR